MLIDEFARIRRSRTARASATTTADASPATVPPEDLSALCLSGGGIRSATFNLGVLQSMAAHGLLDKFDYLSTVSGGGYIGSWLMAWANRGGGIGNVATQLKRRPEPDEVRYLRNYSRYLSPELGMLSADTWTLVSIYLRNLLLNWLVLIPLLLSVLMIPRVWVGVLNVFPLLGPAVGGSDTLETAPRAYVGLLYLVASLFVAVAFGFAVWHEPLTIRTPEARAGAAPASAKKPDPSRFHVLFLWFCLTPLIVGGVLLSLAWAWDDTDTSVGFVTFARFLLPSALVAVIGAILRREARDFLPTRVFSAIAGLLAATALLWLSAKVLEKVGVVLHRDLLSGDAADGIEQSLYATIAVALVLLSLGFGGMIRVGVLSRLPESTDEMREWWSRFGGWVLIACLCWLVIFALVLFGPAALVAGGAVAHTAWTAAGGLTGVATVLLARSARTPATTDAARTAPLGSRVRQLALSIAAPLFVAIAIAALSLGIDALLCLPGPIGLGDAGPAENTAVEHHFALLEGSVPPPGVLSTLNQFSQVFSASWAQEIHKQRPHWRDVFRRAESWNRWDGITLLEHDAAKTAHSRCDKAIAEQLCSALKSQVSLEQECLLRLILFMAVFLVFGLVMSFFIDLNRFSLHGTYRNRLVRAYLGASHTRHPNLFTGFDETDNYAMCKLAGPPDDVPLHIINTTLNLASSEGRPLGLQDRKAESFTVSPLHCGSQGKYRATSEYGGKNPGISVGTAVAISGAAVSPNMGYNTSRAISFLLTLFNVRLGAWLGNPQRPAFRKSAPPNAAYYVILEAFGLTDSNRNFVYLSDGGHFDNLGLYEMVRRKCKMIVVCDAGADPDYGFEDLANAVRRIRIDFGVSIDFRPAISIVGPADQHVASGKYCATGIIHYSKVDPTIEDGCLIYVKPAFYKSNAPVDVRSYGNLKKDFPHESTANQFFSETQFESYRALGSHVIEEIQGNPTSPAASLRTFFQRVQTALAPPDQQQAPPPPPVCPPAAK